ncbi:MAG TPA: hypothetical protein G4O00_02735 [Thermoflexia bacterium]|nr:hypothetical protein [Thermoflexia bacterium]
MTTEAWLPLVLGYLVPIGFFLLAWGGLEPEQGRQAATRGLVALALAALGYFAVGFAFHLGGAGVVSDLPGLAGLDALVGYRVEAGLYWGVLGLDGFFLLGDGDTPEALLLFATYLPMVAAAVLLPVLALGKRGRGGLTVLVGLLTSTLFFPLAACWVWGGGWLAALGRTVGWGHGFVDYAGSGVVFLLAGAISLGGLVALGRKEPQAGPAEMPPAHFPLLANLGVLLATVGWLGWSLGTPFHVAGAEVISGRTVVNGLLGIAGATLTSSLYCWLALGRNDPLMVARGAASGLVALAAGAPFLPSWAALVVGAVAGLALPLGVYLVDRLLRLDDATAAVATTILGGLWGLLSVGLFADGLAGRGWNGVGAEMYRQVAGQGVTGFLAAPGMLGDGPGQSLAQLAGIGAILLLGFGGGWSVSKIAGLLPLRQGKS